MPRYTFPAIRTTRARVGKCPACGRISRRTRAFEHTVNPYNRNPDGSVRSPDEVWATVNLEADAWVPDFRHAKCVGDAS